MHSKIILRRMKAAEKAARRQLGQDQLDFQTTQVKQWQYFMEMAKTLHETQHSHSLISPTKAHADMELIRWAKQQREQHQQTKQDSFTSKNCKDSTSNHNTHPTANSDKWEHHYQDLLNFRKAHGHCLVPHLWSENTCLAHWVKRQRYQYKLKKDGLRTTLTDSRQEALDKLGFAWEPHDARWEERLQDLIFYKKYHGTCNVPASCTYSPRLADWVKSQRRQYRNFMKGKKSKMTPTRIAKLDTLGFIWNPHGLNLTPEES